MELKDLFKNLKNKNKEFKKTGFGINPNLYWKFILMLSFLVIIMFFVLGLILFFDVSKETVNDGEVNVVRLKTINKEKLEEVIEYFAKREKDSANIITLPSPVVDPSR